MSEHIRYNAELLRGIYPVLILKLLKDRSPLYGYQIEKNVRILSDSNFAITQGSLYPILHKLEEKGLVRATLKKVSNRTRKYYSITSKGKQTYAENSAETLSIYDNLRKFLNCPPSTI